MRQDTNTALTAYTGIWGMRNLPESFTYIACCVTFLWPQAALEAVRQDIVMADNAPGGKVEFRRSLAASFLFKFFVHTSLKLEVGPMLRHMCAAALQGRGTASAQTTIN